ncbi:MAG: hemolysin family protein, partial [Sedimentisphaerales bacterium]|nr:hemolysin family protein [Sedimentisphaerales bacterium]
RKLFFSASETAFFNLSRRQISEMSHSKNHFRRLVTTLLKNPKNLLAGILLGDMAISTLYFSFSSVLTLSVHHENGTIAAAIAAGCAFAAFIIFGELMPKSLAYSNSPAIAVATALPCFFCLKVLSPIRYILNTVIVEPSLRLILGGQMHPRPITLNQLKLLIESSRHRGIISADENQLLGEIIELGLLKVRQVMRPRVDIVAIGIKASNAQACELMMNGHLTKLPVYSGTIDNIIGLVDLRQLLLNPDMGPARLAYKVNFVPEQKTVESLLEFFCSSKTDTAIVVDEYGGIAGFVSLADVVEELVGPIEPLQGIEPVKQLGPMTYRLAGSLAIHDWADAFDIDMAESRLATVGGLVIALLGRTPRTGDVAYLKNLTFTVELVRKHRIESIVLELMPLEKSEPTRPSQ